MEHNDTLNTSTPQKQAFEIQNPNTETDTITNNNNNANDLDLDTSKLKSSDNEYLIPDITKLKTQYSVLIIILITAFSLILGLLVFGYIYDLAGIRTFANQHVNTQNQIYPVYNNQISNLNNVNNTKNDISDNHLNASKQFQETKNAISPSVPTDNNLNNADSNQQPTKQNLLDFNNQQLNNQSDNDEKSEKNQTLYQKEIKNLHRHFKKISNQFLILNQKLIQGEPYLDILIDIKTQINASKIATPTLTEYASAGFPTDMIIVTDAIKLLKKLSLIAERNLNPNSVWDFVKNFVIITPQSNTQGLSGVYRKIGKSLNDGDFDTVLELINQSPKNVQKPLQELHIILSDKKTIYNEIKMLNNFVIDDFFNKTALNSLKNK